MNIRVFLPEGFPKIVCLVGSTRFGEAFRRANLEETLKGNIVLTVGSMMHSDDDVAPCIRCGALDDFKGDCRTPEGLKSHDFQPLTSKHHVGTKGKLDTLHFKKIELADEILVLNGLKCKYCKVVKGGVSSARPCVDRTPTGPHEFVPYIGESTRNEIRHALTLKKRIRFLNPQPPWGASVLYENDTSGNTIDETMKGLGLSSPECFDGRGHYYPDAGKKCVRCGGERK